MSLIRGASISLITLKREEARAARKRKRDEERDRLRVEARAARERKQEVTRAAREKQLEEARAVREQIRVREYERIKAEADELIRATPALRQLAIEYWSARSDDDVVPSIKQ
jgi:cell division septum initiation protein DivIVA